MALERADAGKKWIVSGWSALMSVSHIKGHVSSATLANWLPKGHRKMMRTLASSVCGIVDETRQIHMDY